MASTTAVPAQPMAGMAKPKDAGEDDSVTNTPTAGVVKVHGDHLVILRRGRLFTVAIGRGDCTPGRYLAAYGGAPAAGPTGMTQMLISGDTIVVIGYSYQRGGTEWALLRIDRRHSWRAAAPITCAPTTTPAAWSATS